MLNSRVDKFVPWYWMDQPNLKKEYDIFKNNVPNFVSELVDDEESLLLKQLGISKDKYGYWKNGDLIPELKAQEEIKTLRRTKNSSNPR